MGVTVAALVVAFFALQETVVGEEMVRTVRYVPNPSNLPSTKFGVINSIKDNIIPLNLTSIETRINSTNTNKAAQYEQKTYVNTSPYSSSSKLYESNTEYHSGGYSKNLHQYHEEQTQDGIGENYKSTNNEINNKGHVLRLENSGVVTKGNQNVNNYGIKQISQVENENLVSDIEILESQNYHSAGRKNYVEINASERQLKGSKNKEHGSEILYEQIIQLPELHKTIHHNHVPIIRAPVPVSKTATYSINYLYPMNGYNVKNVGSNLFLYKTNNNEERYTHYQPSEDEEIGESDLDHLSHHSYGSLRDWETKLMNNKYEYTASNDKEIDVGSQTYSTDESLELVSSQGGNDEMKLIKTGEDTYNEELQTKGTDITNIAKGFASLLTIKDDEKIDTTQEVKGREHYEANIETSKSIVNSYDIDQNKNEKLLETSVIKNNVLQTGAEESGIESYKFNFYDDNSDYATKENLEVKEYHKNDYENVLGPKVYQNYKYLDADFVPKETSFQGYYNHDDETENIGHSGNEYISNKSTKITVSHQDYVISDVDGDSEDKNYEYTPEQIAGITSYKYVDDEDNQDQKYEYNLGKYDSIYSGTDKNEIISQYHVPILEPEKHHSLANDDSGDSGFEYYENEKLYKSDYNKGWPTSSDTDVYNHYKQYITQDDSEPREYYNNEEIAEKWKHLEGATTKYGSDEISKLKLNNQYTIKYNSETSEHGNTYLNDYEYSPKIYAHVAKPESEFDAHHQYDYTYESGAPSYDGFEKKELVSKYDSKLTEYDEKYYISKYDKDADYHAYEYIPEIKGDSDIVKDYETYEYSSKNGGGYKGYEEQEYIVRDGSEYGVTDNNKYILNKNADIKKLDKIFVSKDDTQWGEYHTIPKHYAPSEESDSTSYIFKGNSDVTQYETSQYVTAGESKYGSYEQKEASQYVTADDWKYGSYEQKEASQYVTADDWKYGSYEQKEPSHYVTADEPKYGNYEQNDLSQYVAEDEPKYGNYEANIPSQYVTAGELKYGNYEQNKASQYVTADEWKYGNYEQKEPSQYVTAGDWKYGSYEQKEPSQYITADEWKYGNYEQYEPSQYDTAGEWKYGNYEQYKYSTSTNDETVHRNYVNGDATKEYESILEDSSAQDVISKVTHYSDDVSEVSNENHDKIKYECGGKYVNDKQTIGDVTKEENGKYFSGDVILENDWTKVDDSLKDDKAIYYNPSITTGNEIKLPINSAKHYSFNEAIYPENDSKFTSETKKNIPYGSYVDTHDQYYKSVHLKNWPLSSSVKNEEQIITSEFSNEDSSSVSYINTKTENNDNVHKIDTIYGNENMFVYSGDSEELNVNKVLEQGAETLGSEIIEDSHNAAELEDNKYYFSQNEKLGIHLDNDEIINKNYKTFNTVTDSHYTDSFTYGTTNSEEYTNYRLELEEPKLNNLKDGLTYGTDPYLPVIYKNHKHGYKSYDSDYKSESDDQGLLYSQKQYLPQKEVPYQTSVDSQELDNKDIDLHIRNWPVSTYKFDPEYFTSLKKEDLTKIGDNELFVKTHIKEPYIASPYIETNLKEDLEVETYGGKSVKLENFDEENENYDEISDFTDEASININNKYSHNTDYSSGFQSSIEPIGLEISELQNEEAYDYSDNVKDIKYDVTEEDNYTPEYENIDIYHSNPSKLAFNDIKYSYPEPLSYKTSTNYDIKENYKGDNQISYINSEALETPLLDVVNSEEFKGDEFYVPETKYSHVHGHNLNGQVKFSLQHNSDKKSLFNCLETELKYNQLGIENLNGKICYENLKESPVISVGAQLSLNSLDSFKIKHPTIHLDNDPIPETKLNEFYSGEDLDEIESVEEGKCKCYNRKSAFPKSNKVKQFSPILTFPIKSNYEIFSLPIKQNKRKGYSHTTIPFIQNSRLVRSPDIVYDCPKCGISQSSLN